MSDRSKYTFVYFVQVADFVKIGHSQEWKRRIANIQTASPFDVRLLHIEVNLPTFETSMHAKFRKFHHRGEWFHAHPDLLAFVAKRAAEPNRSVLNADGTPMEGWTDLRPTEVEACEP